MLMNKAQTCGFLGWTSAEFDRNVSRGFPAKKMNRSRGTDWQVDSREAVQWVAQQEVAKVRPRRRVEPDPEPAPPPGWEAFKAAELVENPALGVGMITALAILYALPRLAANVAADQGVSIEQTFKISAGMLIAVWTFCHQKLDFWPKDEDAVTLLDGAFLTVNWPWLARRGGEPNWRPPTYASGWVPVSDEEFAECVRHGEALDRECEELERADAARAHA
jgi:hypothetical protein